MGGNFPNSVGVRMDAVGVTVPSSGPLTISAWFDADVQQIQCLVQIGDDSNENGAGFYLRTSASNKLDASQTDDSGSNSSAISTSSYGTFFTEHMAAVFETTTQRYVYLDGSQTSDTTSVSWPTGLDSVRLGVQKLVSASTYTEPCDGVMMEVGIWDVALTSAEIAQLGKSGYLAPPMIRPDHLIAYFPIFENGLGTGWWGSAIPKLTNTAVSELSHTMKLNYPNHQDYILPPNVATDQNKWSMLHYGQVYDFQVPLP